MVSPPEVSPVVYVRSYNKNVLKSRIHGISRHIPHGTAEGLNAFWA